MMDDYEPIDAEWWAVNVAPRFEVPNRWEDGWWLDALFGVREPHIYLVTQLGTMIAPEPTIIRRELFGMTTRGDVRKLLTFLGYANDWRE